LKVDQKYIDSQRMKAALINQQDRL